MVNYVCESFSDFIRILLSDEYMKGPIGAKVCKYDVQSICDYFNEYGQYNPYKQNNKCCKYCERYLELNGKILKRTADKIGDWFLECKMDPKYKYCRDRLEREHKKLYDE